MNKLVKLLNKFEKEKIINEGGYVDEDDEYFGRSIEDGEVVNWSYDRDAHGFFKYQIISKDFKFIERLVNKNKIECKDLDLYFLKREQYSECESLIMLLSIQDDPLQFLSQIIK